MYKTTFGPRIQYVYALFFSVIMFSSWSAKGQTAPIVIELESKVEPDCANDQTGILKISVSGGDGNYSYQWSGPNSYSSTSKDLSNIYWGNYTVKVTDDNSNTTEKSFNLQYNDNIPPVVRTKNISISLNSNGTATINVADIDDGSTDNCQIISKTLSKESFNCSDLGPQTVTLTIKDPEGNTGTGNATITVKDEIVPQITAPADIQADTDANDCNASSINLGSETKNDNCGIASVTNDAPSDFPLGETIVTWTVTDNAGNTATDTQKVVISDNTNPTITAPADVQAYTDANDCNASNINLGSETKNDNCGIASVTNDAPSDFPLGETIVTWTVTDNAGNTATDTQKVVISDNTNPTITAPADIQADTDANDCNASSINLGSETKNDNCGIASVTNDAPSDFPLGETIVTWTVTDNAGNTATDTQKVVISDNTNPTITAPADVQAYTDANDCNASNINLGSESANDNCGIALIENDAPAEFPLGETMVTWTVTDNSGNTATAIQKVVISDNTIPVITAGSDVNATNDTGLCQAGLSIAPATATDNCSTPSPVGSRSDGLGIGEPYPSGITVITWTVEDDNGNIADSVDQIITVKDNEVPSLPTVEDVLWGCEYTVDTPVAIDNCDGEIIGTTSAPLTYSTSGTYTIDWTFTDESGNSSQLSQKIIIDELKVEVSITHVECNGFETGEAIANVSGGVQPYYYSWKNIVTNSSLGNNSIENNLAAGNYSVTVTDLNGCELTKDIEILQPDALNMEEPDSSPASCYKGNDGTIVVGNMTGGKTPYSYSIDNTNFQSETIFKNLTAGDYTIFVKDANNCSLQKDISVIEPNELKATLTKTDVSCFVNEDNDPDGKIIFTNPTGGTSGFEFSIDGTNWQETPEFTELTEGTYPVYIRDASVRNCAKFLKEIMVNQPEELVISVDKTRTTSFGSPTATVTVNASGGTPGYTYQWRKYDENNNLGSVFANTKTINNQSAGDYQVTVMDKNSCPKSMDVEIIDKVFVEIIASSLCDDVDNELRTSRFSVNLETIAGGIGPVTDFSYTWDFGDGARPESNTGEGEIKVEYDFPGDKIITLTVTDNTKPAGITSSYTFNHYAGECFEDCGQSMNFDIDRNSFYIGDQNGNDINTNNCSQNTAKYLWVNIIKSSNAYALNTELVYTITDEKGNTTQKKAIDCFGTKVEVKKNKYEWELIPVGNYRLFKIEESTNLDSEIEWECGKSFKIEALSMRYVTNSKKDCGDTNKNQCIGLSDEVGVSTPVIASVQFTNALCYDEPTGAISISASGGIKPYKFSISGNIDNNYQTSPDFFNLPAGTYNDIWVKDLVGKKIKLPKVEITQPDEISFNVKITDPVCLGDLGIAEVTNVNGGTPISPGEYEYIWNDSETKSGSKVNLNPGEYTVTVTDANGCQAIASVTIEKPAELTTPLAGDDQNLGCGSFSTMLSANTPEVGKGQWIIDSDNSPSGGQFENDKISNTIFTGAEGTEGTYTLIWTISNEDGKCTETDKVLITMNGACSELDFDGVDDYIDVDNSYPLTSNNFSFEVWVKTESTTGNQTIFSKKDKSNPAGGYEFTITNGNPTFKWNGNTLSSNYKLIKNKWFHVAVIYNVSTARIYVNGIDVGNTSGASNPTATSAPFIIGAIYNSASTNQPANFFTGWMEELRIWNKALTVDQLRFMMYQRINLASKENSSSIIEGEMIPNKAIEGSYFTQNGLNLDKNEKPFYDLKWENLLGYYRLVSNNPDPAGYLSFSANEKPSNGYTQDFAISSNAGKIRNIQTNQENTSPTPYVSSTTASSTNWDASSTWLRPDVWNIPNFTKVSNKSIDWNIVKSRKDISIGRNLYLLGLLSESGHLELEGTMKMSGNQSGTGTGNGLTVTHYLKLNGSIDLNGESQLVQPQGSILDGSSNGYIDIDQQGTANSFNYNYWTSPVTLKGSANNSGFKIKEVLLNGDNGETLNFNYQYHWADNYNYNSEKKRISSYWLYTFKGTADDYSRWEQISENELLEPGIGYSMKGTSGYVPLENRQNYTFRGKPNNGDIPVNINLGQNLLTGNPYPSAINATDFINDNPGFDGSLYFWDHFGKEDTHYLEKYVGGYAVLNKSGAIGPASSIDSRINDNGTINPDRIIPGEYIPVGQAFFLTKIKETNIPGDITFKNKYRAFVQESTEDSHFLMQEDPASKKTKEKNTYKKDSRFKIRLKFESPKGYHRQILVTADGNSTNGFDLGYDAPLIENNVEDMYWMIDDTEFVIQAVPNFNLDQVLPFGIKVAQEGEYTIKIDEFENFQTKVDVYLKDVANETYHNLTDTSYTATAEEIGSFNQKFELVFRKPGSELPTEKEKPEIIVDDSLFGLNYLKKTDEISLYNPDLMHIDFVELYSISGQKIMTFYDVATEESVLSKN